MSSYNYIPDTELSVYSNGQTPTKRGTVSRTLMFGVKELSRCVETWHSAALHQREPKKFDRCFSGVMNIGDVVHPASEEEKGAPDLRSNHLRVLNMWADDKDNTPCAFGFSPLFLQEYRVGMWYTVVADKSFWDVNYTHTSGLHFRPSEWAAGPNPNFKQHK